MISGHSRWRRTLGRCERHAPSSAREQRAETRAALLGSFLYADRRPERLQTLDSIRSAVARSDIDMNGHTLGARNGTSRAGVLQLVPLRLSAAPAQAALQGERHVEFKVIEAS
jgi:hypothetical protein